MKPSALLAIALCLSACGTARPVLESDSTWVEVKTVVETIHDTAYVQLPVIVERIVADIDSIVKIVRFDGWQSTTAGKQEVKKALRSVVWIKYKIKDKEVFDKAYNYIEQYY